MAIGNFGSAIIFETSDNKVLNFTQFKRQVSSRWASHPRIGQKPVKQFLGPDIDKVTFTVILDARHGVKPRNILEVIDNSIIRGSPEYLIIGCRRIGSSKFVITSKSETWDEIFNNGELVRASMELTFEEYL